MKKFSNLDTNLQFSGWSLKRIESLFSKYEVSGILMASYIEHDGDIAYNIEDILDGGKYSNYSIISNGLFRPYFLISISTQDIYDSEYFCEVNGKQANNWVGESYRYSLFGNFLSDINNIIVDLEDEFFVFLNISSQLYNGKKVNNKYYLFTLELEFVMKDKFDINHIKSQL